MNGDKISGIIVVLIFIALMSYAVSITKLPKNPYVANTPPADFYRKRRRTKLVCPKHAAELKPGTLALLSLDHCDFCGNNPKKSA